MKGSALPPFFGFNAALASCLHIVDIGLNSSLEYSDLPGQDPLDGSNDAIIAFVQVLLQIAALVNLLVLLGATFLFRSGLFGLLYAQFRLVLLVQLCYIGLTIVLGVARTVRFLPACCSDQRCQWVALIGAVLSAVAVESAVDWGHADGYLGCTWLHGHLRGGAASASQVLQPRVLDATVTSTTGTKA
ncbi:hypothetical protein BBJ28_00021088 [Nothophytophthora sp. Chile5]|nr:hypothetical protein BBJ28_00021088 [Nothophytophthora sp. Chile5]